MAVGLFGLEAKEEVDKKAVFYACCHVLTDKIKEVIERLCQGQAIAIHQRLVVMGASAAVGGGQEAS